MINNKLSMKESYALAQSFVMNIMFTLQHVPLVYGNY